MVRGHPRRHMRANASEAVGCPAAHVRGVHGALRQTLGVSTRATIRCPSLRGRHEFPPPTLLVQETYRENSKEQRPQGEGLDRTPDLDVSGSSRAAAYPSRSASAASTGATTKVGGGTTSSGHTNGGPLDVVGGNPANRPTTPSARASLDPLDVVAKRSVSCSDLAPPKHFQK